MPLLIVLAVFMTGCAAPRAMRREAMVNPGFIIWCHSNKGNADCARLGL